MSPELEKLYNLLTTILRYDCPVLSGNMKANISTRKISDNKVLIIIKAPMYDMNVWKTQGIIVPPYTGKYSAWDKNGKFIGNNQHYANLVNTIGPWGKGGKSMHWVNRSCNEAATTIAVDLGATVDNRLPL